MLPECCTREFAELAFYGDQKMQNWPPLAAISEDSFLVFGVKMR